MLLSLHCHANCKQSEVSGDTRQTLLEGLSRYIMEATKATQAFAPRLGLNVIAVDTILGEESSS